MVRDEITKLLQPLVESDPIYRDHFALGCYLLTMGHPRAGKRVCDSSLKSAGLSALHQSKIMAGLEEHVVDMGRVVRPKEEIVSLLKS